MAPNIENAVEFALAQTGKPYDTGPDRFGPDYFDCSGLIIAALRHAGIDVPAGVGNTVDLYNWAKRVGGLVSVTVGVATRGAIMIKGRSWGYGPLGHASFSTADPPPREMAAHGHLRGIGSNVMDVDFYQDAFIIPGVVGYGGTQPPAPTPPRKVEPMAIQQPGRAGNPIGRTAYVCLSDDGKRVECWNGASIKGDSGDRPRTHGTWTPDIPGPFARVGAYGTAGIFVATDKGETSIGLWS